MSVKEQINKKLKSASVFRNILIVFAAISVLLTVFLAIMNPSFIGLGIFLIMIDVILLIVYIEKYIPFKKSMKLIGCKGMNWEEFVEDIDNAPFLPKSKIYCGQKALVTKNNIILPYSFILWVYQHITRAYGVITVDQTIIFMTDSGKQFNISMNVEELKVLLVNKHHEFPSDMMIGYNEANRKRYCELLKR